jgi:hypothetical protein
MRTSASRAWRVAVCLKWPNEQALNVLGERRPCHDVWKQLKRWVGEQLRAQRNDIEVVSEMRDDPTVPRVAEHSWVALAIVADASQVAAGDTAEKYVRTRVQLRLSTALEATAESGERGERRALRDGYEDIGVFGAGLGGQQRSQNRDANYARYVASTDDELASEFEERGAHVARGARSVLPNVVGDGSRPHSVRLKRDARVAIERPS